MERHFHCTACGKCCFGLLPLTLDDAVRHAGRFPLAMIWTPVRQANKSFALSKRLGTTMRLPRKQEAAVLVMPTAYIPQSFSCPELTAEGLCGIHADKPARCRTMPFYPYREEKDQADLLIPRKDWACDTSPTAPVVYRDKAIVDRTDFDRERAELERQAPALRSYADLMLKAAPGVADALEKLAMKPMGGKLVLGFSTFLRLNKHVDAALVAERQIPVLTDFAARTAGVPELAEYHQHYQGFAREMERFVRR
jgi:Fe-S-cluster containining protein